MTVDEAIQFVHDELDSETAAVIQREVEQLRKELVGELISLRALAQAYCANATADYANRRIQELEAAAAAKGESDETD
jgi:hypothetical protein